MKVLLLEGIHDRAVENFARHGYTEVRPFSRGPYSDHWFVKDGPFGT